MGTSHTRTMIAGLAGGMSANLTMLLTFRLLGFGWNGNGILLHAQSQSEKLIAVWTTIEPLPLVVKTPLPIITGMVLFGVLHAYLFRWLSPAWPIGLLNRGLRFGGLIFGMVYLFWEFFTPFNMFGEPLPLIALELVFWCAMALAEGLAIAAVMERGESH